MYIVEVYSTFILHYANIMNGRKTSCVAFNQAENIKDSIYCEIYIVSEREIGREVKASIFNNEYTFKIEAVN